MHISQIAIGISLIITNMSFAKSLSPNLESGYVFTIDINGSLNKKEDCRPSSKFNSHIGKKICTPTRFGFECLGKIEKYNIFWFTDLENCQRALTASKRINISPDSYILRRTSVVNSNIYHLATFDAVYGQGYNKGNCEIARDLFQGQGVKVTYFCSKK